MRAVLGEALGSAGEAPLGPGLPTRLLLRERPPLHGVRRSAGTELDRLLRKGFAGQA